MKQDYLKECMSDVRNPPLDVFQKTWCTYCQSGDCVRSSANNMQFNQRVEGWKESLFESPPRADGDDPKFEKIRLQRFTPVSRGRTYEVRETGEVPIISAPEGAERVPARFLVSEEPAEPPPPEPPPPEPVRPPPPLEPSVRPAESPPEVRDVGNTPFVQGTVLEGGGEKVEKPGSTYVFGGDD